MFNTLKTGITEKVIFHIGKNIVEVENLAMTDKTFGKTLKNIYGLIKNGFEIEYSDYEIYLQALEEMKNRNEIDGTNDTEPLDFEYDAAFDMLQECLIRGFSELLPKGTEEIWFQLKTWNGQNAKHYMKTADITTSCSYDAAFRVRLNLDGDKFYMTQFSSHDYYCGGLWHVFKVGSNKPIATVNIIK